MKCVQNKAMRNGHKTEEKGDIYLENSFIIIFLFFGDDTEL